VQRPRWPGGGRRVPGMTPTRAWEPAHPARRDACQRRVGALDAGRAGSQRSVSPSYEIRVRSGLRRCHHARSLSRTAPVRLRRTTWTRRAQRCCR
jgi:hypothetical protein